MGFVIHPPFLFVHWTIAEHFSDWEKWSFLGIGHELSKDEVIWNEK